MVIICRIFKFHNLVVELEKFLSKFPSLKEKADMIKFS